MLYATMLPDALEALRGAISMGTAFELVVVTLALWIVLAILLVIAITKGSMPRWAALSAIAWVPVSAISTFVAMSMTGEPRRWPIVFPVMVPVVIAIYATWVRLPRLHAMFPARITTIGALAVIFILSIAPIALSLFHWVRHG